MFDSPARRSTPLPVTPAGAQADRPFDNGFPLAGLVRGSAAMRSASDEGVSTFSTLETSCFLGRFSYIGPICGLSRAKYIRLPNLRR
jgi:hypothetical protein